MGMQQKINKSYIISHYLKIFILLKLYVDFFQKLRKIEKNYDFDLKGKSLVLNHEEIDKPNSPTNNPTIYSGVLLHSGEFVYEDIDLHIPGRGFDFVFKRTYRSQVMYSGVLGWGWGHNYNRRLLELPGGDILYFDGTGRRERFVKGETAGTYTPAPGRFIELKKMVDGSFRFIYPDRTIEFFDENGRLVRIQNRNFNKMEFLYNYSGQLSTVMDTMGQFIEFEYYPSDFDETSGDMKQESGRLKT
ncbi:MAG: DUF6531 domain-containing protein, partial [Candidatus Thorarchaeota archaeon]